jgi:hypothetical protein
VLPPSFHNFFFNVKYSGTITEAEAGGKTSQQLAAHAVVQLKVL